MMFAAFWIDLEFLAAQGLAVAAIIAGIGLVCVSVDRIRARRNGQKAGRKTGTKAGQIT